MKNPVNTFKQGLKDGRQLYGFWLGFCNPLSAELCGHCGYDWLLIDAEHAPNDLGTIQSQLLAIDNTPSHPIIRIVEGSSALIKQMLDLGAQSLLVPMVETAEQARQLVSAVRYPPRGTRGVGTALARAARWNQVERYFDDADQQICLLIQIESVRGIENLDDILQIEGIDGVFLGPADLAASMGYLGQPSHPDVVAAMESAIKSIRAAGKAAGTLATNKDIAGRYEHCGVQFVALGVDTLALASSARSILSDHLDERETQASEGNGAY